MEWDLAIKLSTIYGLRHIEVSHITSEIHKNNGEFIFCSYQKRDEAGISKPRWLWPLNPEWEQKWKSIERIKRKDPLPKLRTKEGDAFKNYLSFNNA
tara:strand:- start:1908 stop:2198 length:291 start_codon:yes stop_codon:yes gene_type:complete